MFSMCKYDWKTNSVIENSHPLAGNDYLAFARKLKQIGLENGIVCNQSHAPFPTRCPQIRAYYKRAIECTAEAGGSICVIHPDNYKSAEENAEMKGSDTTAVEMVKALGDRLLALHIYDNDKLNDSHQIPFSMNIDFVEVVKALKEINYNGYFTLEADSFLKDYTEENVMDGIKKLAESARKMADMFEA
ncbi:MAG: sugar phosphate isomerase/epimerase [Ruminococcaceae bacterium]|nr:sugar phosphate isomerase/epimerase [Oscillospiraceae bacterium]